MSDHCLPRYDESIVSVANSLRRHLCRSVSSVFPSTTALTSLNSAIA
ncbi:MAG: hypothetical protein LBQ33_05835 [Oscillospiraceae bacterium]|jgi:hypothetical protein|nr:hypothetical protein [Oscillospiraceae bacterium]